MRYDCLIIDDERLLADSTAEYFNLFGVKTELPLLFISARTSDDDKIVAFHIGGDDSVCIRDCVSVIPENKEDYTKGTVGRRITCEGAL